MGREEQRGGKKTQIAIASGLQLGLARDPGWMAGAVELPGRIQMPGEGPLNLGGHYTRKVTPAFPPSLLLAPGNAEPSYNW